MPMPPASRRSLQVWLPVAAALLLLGLATALTLVYRYEARRLATELAASRLFTTVDRIATSVGTGVPRSLDAFGRMAGDTGVVRLLQDGRSTLADSGERTLQRFPADSNTVTMLWDLGEGPAVAGFARADTSGGWVTRPRSVDSVLLGPVEVSAESVVYYDVVAPVRIGGEFAGMLQRRTRVLPSEQTAATVAAMLGEHGVLLLGSHGGAWTDFSGAVPAPDTAVSTASEAFRYQRDGVERLGIGRAIPGTSWILVAELPFSAALAPAQGVLGRMAVVGLLLAAIGSLAAWHLGRGVTQPLRSLRHAALAIREGESQVRAVPSGHAELRDVATVFNQMADATGEHLRTIAASEQRFRSLVTASAQIVFWTDASGHVREPLPSWQAFTGQGFEEMRGSGWTRAVHPDDVALAVEAWQEALEHRSFFETEYRVRRHDGEYRRFLARGVPVLAADGTVLEWVGTFTDITRQREVEETLQRKEVELRQAQRLDAIGRLAGGVAHDFNNLLTAIMVPAELSRDRLPEGDPVRLDLEEIRDAAHRATELTRQLLVFGRKQVMDPEVLELDEVVSAAGRMLKRVIPESVQLELSLEGGSGLVRVDRSQLEQVIINLAVNARDAMPEGGRLTIETERVVLTPEFCERHPGVTPGRYVLLAMTDTGTGMDEAVRSQIFEPFFTTKGHGKGTGLGLSTVYGIVRQSDGHIWVYSEPGRGTAFKVYFPEAVGEGQAADSDSAPTPPPTGHGTILFAEDDAALRRLGVRILTGLGYTVLPAEHGDAALAAAAAHAGPIDLLVSDVVMPGMSGIELWEQLRRVRGDVPALFLSGWASDAVVRHRILEGEVPFLQKPFSVEQLGRKVAEVLRGGGAPS